MFSEIKKEVPLIKTLVWLSIVVLGIHLFSIFFQFLSNFADILVIIVIAWLFSFVLEPVVDWICATFSISKKLSTSITYLLLFAGFVAIAFLFLPLITSQIQTLSKVLPKFLNTSPEFIQRWGDNITHSLNNSIVVLPSIAQFLISTIIVLVISFYFIIDKDRINKEIFYLTPKEWHEKVRFIQNAIETTFASFLRIQVIIGLLIGFSTWIVLEILHIQFAAAIGLLAGILGFIPLVGPILAIVPPLFFTFIIDPSLSLIVLFTMVIIDQLIFNIFVPKAFGNAFRMNPVIILISSLVGYRIAGPMGAIFAIPILGISAIVIRDISHYFLKKDE